MYGVDAESGILAARSWRWLVVRIQGLLAADTRLSRHFAPDDEKNPGGESWR